MLVVDVISRVHLSQVPVGVRQVPLALAVAGVVAGHGGRNSAELRQDAALHVAGVKIAADAQSLNHKLTSSFTFGGFIQGVIDRVVVVVHVIGIDTELTREILAVQNLVVISWIGQHPGEVAESERRIQVDGRGRSWRGSGSRRGLRIGRVGRRRWSGVGRRSRRRSCTTGRRRRSRLST